VSSAAFSAKVIFTVCAVAVVAVAL
jgi:hypothetical protein